MESNHEDKLCGPYCQKCTEAREWHGCHTKEQGLAGIVVILCGLLAAGSVFVAAIKLVVRAL